ncbi:MAG TPA: NAD(P)H-dependent oxidoreductase [Solirubrobacteraceae bacterium]|jgi:chromate reductase|nr:NAD(P)H-dependent oxidoreductase [Solirubrobacteraceae bacterium]
MRVLGISGSLRRDSHNTRLLQAAGELLPAGSELEVFDGLAEIPPFSEDDEHAPPPSVIALKDAIASADAVLFATPEYNGSIPGQLKNALDWVSRPRASTPLAGKPVAVIGASMGLFGAVWAQAELRKVLSTIGARVVERDLPVGQAHEALDAYGLPLDAEAREALRQILAELIELADALAVAA